MSFRQIIYIVGGSIIAALIVTVIILSCIVSSKDRELAIVKNDRNYLSQTIDKLKSENIKQQEILDERNKLLQEVKNAKSPQEYYKVWDKINRSLK